MIAGGTGVTPMYQVAAAILKDPADTTRISLLFGNLTADDILIKQELEALAAAHPKRFSVLYVLNTPPAIWTGGGSRCIRGVQSGMQCVGVLRCVLHCSVLQSSS
jgi:cytochrome-b5 reductase